MKISYKERRAYMVKFIPLILFLMGFVTIAVGSFLLNTIIGLFVTGAFLIIMGLMFATALNTQGDKR